MPIDMRTHGLDWRQHVRDDERFAVLVTPNYVHDRLCQRQLAYARALGKPVYFLVQAGMRWADVRVGERAFTWQTMEDLATLLTEIERGDR